MFEKWHIWHVRRLQLFKYQNRSSRRWLTYLSQRKLHKRQSLKLIVTSRGTRRLQRERLGLSRIWDWRLRDQPAVNWGPIKTVKKRILDSSKHTGEIARFHRTNEASVNPTGPGDAWEVTGVFTNQGSAVATLVNAREKSNLGYFRVYIHWRGGLPRIWTRWSASSAPQLWLVFSIRLPCMDSD